MQCIRGDKDVMITAKWGLGLATDTFPVPLVELRAVLCTKGLLPTDDAASSDMQKHKGACKTVHPSRRVPGPWDQGHFPPSVRMRCTLVETGAYW